MVATFANYQELVDRALMIEGKQQQIESRKRKYGQGKYNSGAQQKPRYTPYSGGHTHTHGGHNHGGNGDNRNHDNNSKSGNGGNGNQHRPAPAQKDLSHITCFKCKKIGIVRRPSRGMETATEMEAQQRSPTLLLVLR